MSIFEKLANETSNETIERAGDYLGGGGLLESGIYDMIIKMAYLDESKAGAHNVNFEFAGQNGETLKTTIYITSTKEKGQKNYTESNGKKRYSFGYNLINDICLLTAGMEPHKITYEERDIQMYDYNAGGMVIKKKDVMVGILGMPVKLGILKQVVDKNVNVGNNKWIPSGETKETNEVNKVFRAADGKTVDEIQKNVAEAELLPAWDKKFKGTVQNKAKGAKAAKAGSSIPTSNTAPTPTVNIPPANAQFGGIVPPSPAPQGAFFQQANQ